MNHTIQAVTNYSDLTLLGGLALVLFVVAIVIAYTVHFVALLRGKVSDKRAGVEPSQPWPRTYDAPIYSERRPERRPPLE